MADQRIAAALCLASTLALVMISFVQGTTITILNQCTEELTACRTDQVDTSVQCYVLGASGGTQSIDVGTTWTGGLFWAFPASNGVDSATGLKAKPQANLAEFTIVAGGQDSYDLSNVNAYNLGIQISLPHIAGGTTPSGTTCGSPSCTISNLNTVCQSPNTFTNAPGDGCYNTDGPGSVPTSGTEKFATACPEAFSYSNDYANHVYGCPTTSTYKVTWCP